MYNDCRIKLVLNKLKISFLNLIIGIAIVLGIVLFAYGTAFILSLLIQLIFPGLSFSDAVVFGSAIFCLTGFVGIVIVNLIRWFRWLFDGSKPGA